MDGQYDLNSSLLTDRDSLEYFIANFSNQRDLLRENNVNQCVDTSNSAIPTDIFRTSQYSGITDTKFVPPIPFWDLPENQHFTRNPCLSPYKGIYDFRVLVSGNTNNKKWFYSSQLNKVFTGMNCAFPVNISVAKWCDAKVSVMAVFKTSNNRTNPVKRCLNHAQLDELNSGHIIQLEGNPDANYYNINNRLFVMVPLSPPNHGETTSTILVKSTCLTSCVGGPNRRNFVLVFTLWVEGKEAGREIIDFKCCKCPFRDMSNEEQKQSLNINTTTTDSTVVTVPTEDATESVCKKIKLEIADQTVKVKIPNEFLPAVRKLINRLTAEDIVKNTLQFQQLPYPDEED